MKKSANGNMYEVAAQETRGLFGTHLYGAPLPLVCVVSVDPLGDQARTALENSARALGYGDACAFASITDSEGPLDTDSLFFMIEGLDPLCLIAADESAARSLSDAYRQPIFPNQACRLMGRTAIAFHSFEAMLDDDHDKQVAWALLKKLPRRTS